MAIIASGNETYLLLTGVHTDTAVRLGPHTELLPATCHLNYDEFANLMKESYVDFAVGLLVIPLVRSQLHVTAESPKQLAVRAWNAQWDCLLLSALFDQTVLWNVQSDVPAEMIGPSTAINISNYHLSGFHIKGEWKLTTADKEWLEKYFETARGLISNPRFQTAAHSLASFRWHTHARAQLALIWSGIEALFGIESEIVFRVSLYTARFLEPDDETERLKVFAKVKSLYKHRSAAVHGSNIKGDAGLAVKDSAELLRRLVRQCSEMNQLPDIETLAP